jgi:hypothetical protein
MSFHRVIWSPVEHDYLKSHSSDPINQLCIALAKSRSAIQKKLREIDGWQPAPTKKKGGRSKIGRRPDCNNQFFRSGWEANVYRLLMRDKSVTLIEYEPTTFSFAPFGILKGTVSYCPDFKITYPSGVYNWIEVKGGFMKPADKTKIKRFKKFYPEEFKKLLVVAPGPNSKTSGFFKEQGVPIKWHYPDLNKQYKHLIPNWE